MTMFDENDISKGLSTLKKKLFTNISLKIDNYRKEFNLSSFQMILQ
jgi:predicted transcriptional regulator